MSDSSRSGSVYEWRAAAADDSDVMPDYSPWFNLREEAERHAATMRDAEPPFERVWLERRQCSVPIEIYEDHDYDIALRPDSAGELDDVVVRHVETFRAEAMSEDCWWMACYLRNGERICWSITTDDPRSAAHKRRYPLGIKVTVTEWPDGAFVYEPGSMHEGSHA